MKKIVFINGLLAALIIVGISSFMLWSAGADASHSHSAWLGYLVMIIGLSMIFIGVKQHRDNNLGGIIGFKQAFMVGILISLVAASCYVLAWEFYYQSAGQGYLEAYQQSYLDNMVKEGASESAIDSSLQEMRAFADLYAKFYFRGFITLIEILPVGLLISVLSALLLKTRSKG